MKKALIILVLFISYGSIAQNDIQYYSPEKEAQKILAYFAFDFKASPGDRITLHLKEEQTIFGKTYKKGTEIYAYTSLNDQNRIMLDIKNIEGNPVKLERAEDYGDNLEGIYIHIPKKKKKKKDLEITFLSGHKVILFFSEA